MFRVNSYDEFQKNYRNIVFFCIVVTFLVRRHSQVVRQRSAKPLSPGSNPGVAFFVVH